MDGPRASAGERAPPRLSLGRAKLPFKAVFNPAGIYLRLRPIHAPQATQEQRHKADQDSANSQNGGDWTKRRNAVERNEHHE